MSERWNLDRIPHGGMGPHSHGEHGHEHPRARHETLVPEHRLPPILLMGTSEEDEAAQAVRVEDLTCPNCREALIDESGNLRCPVCGWEEEALSEVMGRLAGENDPTVRLNEGVDPGVVGVEQRDVKHRRPSGWGAA